MCMRRTEMHRLQDLVRHHRLGTGCREIARLLGMSPNTERRYREALEEALLRAHGNSFGLPHPVGQLGRAPPEERRRRPSPLRHSGPQRAVRWHRGRRSRRAVGWRSRRPVVRPRSGLWRVVPRNDARSHRRRIRRALDGALGCAVRLRGTTAAPLGAFGAGRADHLRHGVRLKSLQDEFLTHSQGTQLLPWHRRSHRTARVHGNCHPCPGTLLLPMSWHRTGWHCSISQHGAVCGRRIDIRRRPWGSTPRLLDSSTVDCFLRRRRGRL
jgi:hypothetical protein